MKSDIISDAFPSFRVLEELGLYVWRPGCDSNDMLIPHARVKASDITGRLSVSDGGDDSLAKLLSGLKLHDSTEIPVICYSALRFPLIMRRDLPPQKFPNRFPNDAGYVVPLFVAFKRGLDLSTIDFILGGSSMDYLANRLLDPCDTCVYLAQKLRNLILFVKYKEYTQDYSHIGFQFERLVTGRQMEDVVGPNRVENLRVIKIGPFSCLVAADVDATDASGNLVEIKSGNPNYFGIKLILQMISSGSKILVNADKRGQTLLGINRRTLSDLIREETTEELKAAEMNIIESLASLKQANILETVPSEIRFNRNNVILEDSNGKSILPSADVLEELLGLAEKL